MFLKSIIGKLHPSGDASPSRDMMISSAKKQLAACLDSSSLPHHTLWFSSKIDSPESTFALQALQALEEDNVAFYLGDGFWCGQSFMRRKRANVKKEPLQSLSYWEDQIADRLLQNGFRIVRHGCVLSYDLDIIMEKSEDKKLDVEIDLYADRHPDGRRRDSDIFRDVQLQSSGWHVLRLWIPEIRNDFEGQFQRIMKTYQDL